MYLSLLTWGCIYWFLEREDRVGRERERHRWERNMDQLPPLRAPTGDQTCNLVMCPDWGLNPRPFVVLQPTEPPGRRLFFFLYNELLRFWISLSKQKSREVAFVQSRQKTGWVSKPHPGYVTAPVKCGAITAQRGAVRIPRKVPCM